MKPMAQSEVSIDRYRAMLKIVKHQLDDELEIQPQVMQAISTQVVLHNSRMLAAKEDLEQVEARLLLDYRESADKMTVAEMNAKILRHADRVRAWERYQEARALHEDWSGLLECWRGRGFALKTLADLYQAQYFSLDHTTTERRPRERNDNYRPSIDRRIPVGTTPTETKSTRRTLA